MLQTGDIKIAHRNSPELFLQPQAAKLSTDNSSAASFFSILRGQLDTARQPDAEPAAKTDMMQDGARVESREREEAREISRPAQQGEENTRTEPADSGKAQKEAAGAQNTNKEAKPADEKKPVAGSRPADGAEQKKAAESTDPAQRTARPQRAKKTDDADMRELFDGLHRMIDIIKGKEQAELRAVKAGGREADDLMSGSRGAPDRGMLKNLLDRLAVLMKKADAKSLTAEQADSLGRMVAGMKDLLQKSRHGMERGRGQAASAPDQNTTAVKDLLVRIETLLEGAKGEAPQNRQGGDARGNSDLFAFSAAKSDPHAKRADAAPAHRNGANFMDQVSQIIDSAKVVVRDSRNGSFSVRLHPRELGSMNVSLGLENGIVHGKFLVESAEARDLLMGSLDQIRQRLEDAGIAVGGFHVDVDDRRGRMLREAEDESAVYAAPVERREEIAAGFESNSKSFHDGHVNLVI